MPELFTCLVTSASPFSTMSGYLGLTTWTYPARVGLRNGASVVVHSWDDLTTVWAVWFGNEYRIRKSDKVFIDLGANIGAFSSYICSLPDRTVYAVEPFPENVTRLANNLESQVLSGQCHIFAHAIDWTERTLHMQSSPSIPSHSRTVSSGPGDETVEVTTVTLPNVVNRAGGAVDLLKVDIEGYEFELFGNIASGDLNGIQRIALEYHGLGGQRKLVELLTPHGFQLSYHKAQGTRGIAEFIRCP